MSKQKILTKQKLRGSYYTPQNIAQAITEWALSNENQYILEPSFGKGVFLKTVLNTLENKNRDFSQLSKFLYGIEIDKDEYNLVKSSIANKYNIKLNNLFNDDFFNWSLGNKREFDVVLGNPPFIRYQNFPEPSRTYSMNLALQQGVKVNKLTNIWVLFVIVASGFLKENGKLGMVIPAELLQVSYANALRNYLIKSFSNITIFSCNELIFNDAEQEVVILLADGKKQVPSGDANIQIIETFSRKELEKELRNIQPCGKKLRIVHSTEKWTKYFLTQEQIDLMRSLRSDKRIVKFGDYFDVDVGVVTGKNDFFIVNKDLTQQYKLDQYIRPIIGRSYLLKDEIITENDWQVFWNNNERVGLLDLTDINGKIPAGVQKYLDLGLAEGIHHGYKCSIRKEWYKVPSIWIPYAFMFRQIHDFPHLILNKANALSTDTIHRVKRKNGKNFPQVLFYTYLTAASAEIEGRSYGGGVLELEPSEVERLLIPNPELFDHDQLDYMIIRKENGTFLKKNSSLILSEFLGLNNKEVTLLKSIYMKLFERRKSRKINKSIMRGKPFISI